MPRIWDGASAGQCAALGLRSRFAIEFGMKKFFGLLAVVLAATACSSSSGSTNPAPTTVVILGTWGGDHAGLIATSTGGTVEYDCATGRITQPLVAGADGQFLATGTHTPGHGGPALPDETLPERPARYSGHVSGDLLTLTVVMTDSNQTVGTFDLTRGRSPNVFKCL